VRIGKIIPAIMAAAGIILLVIWWTQTPGVAFVPRVDKADQARLDEKHAEQAEKAQLQVPTWADFPLGNGKFGPAGSSTKPASEPAGEYGLRRFEGKAADLPGEWPQFRGPKRDGVCTDKTPLARGWPTKPKVLWQKYVGEGHAGPAVLNGKIYILDYDTDRRADVLRCMSLADGQDIWAYSYPVKVKRNHGMSRTVPAVTDKYVVSVGPKCHVTCLNSSDGRPRWQIDMVAKFGATVPAWYAGQCPLIDDGKVILAPGGGALMVAVDCETGKILWHTPNPLGWKMTHSSITPVELDGTKMYVYCASRGVVGVDAETGRLLWSTTDWTVRMANVPSPVPVGEGRILLAGGYNEESGCVMLQLRRAGGRIVPEVLFRRELAEFSAVHHTPVLHEGRLYAVRKDGQLACMDLDGKVLWSSGADHDFGLGPFLIAGDLVYAMNDDGLLTLAEITNRGFRRLARMQAVSHEKDGKVVRGHDAWAPMALVGGRLILRDLTKMVCLDVRPAP